MSIDLKTVQYGRNKKHEERYTRPDNPGPERVEGNKAIRGIVERDNGETNKVQTYTA